MKTKSWIVTLSSLALLLALSGYASSSTVGPAWRPMASATMAWAPASVATSAAGCTVAITEPRPGQEVAGRTDAAGKATLPPNYHLWLFARRVSYRPLELWWPQGEAVVEQGTWKMPVSIGAPEEIGGEFDVTAAVFDQEQHLKLREHFRNEAFRPDYQPIEMPAATCVAGTLTVKKTRQ